MARKEGGRYKVAAWLGKKEAGEGQLHGKDPVHLMARACFEITQSDGVWKRSGKTNRHIKGTQTSVWDVGWVGMVQP